MTEKTKKKIIAHIASRLNDIIPNTPIIKAYEKAIMAMTDEQLENWIVALENGILDFPDQSKPSATINIVAPNLDRKNQLNIERNLALAKKMGHSFFERIWLTNPVTKQVSLTNRRYMVLDMPIRRQAQTLDTKISLPESDTKVDDMTGQVTGDSKGASISYPEVQMLAAQGLENTLYELLKARGGDENSWALMKRHLIESGSFDTNVLDQLESKAKVNTTFSHILTGMHIKNNL